MSIVVGLENPDYGETRAIELISEAQIVARQFSYPQLEEADIKALQKLRDEYHEKMAQAMSLLALSRVQRDGTT